MTSDARRAREARIVAAAFAVLAEQGLGGLSMLAVARRARASNETLYRWYGDKAGLLRVLAIHRSREVAAEVDAVLIAGGAPEAVLDRVGALLLEVWMEPRWVELCRAAAAQAGNGLGAELDATWRGWVVPRVVQLFVRLRASGQLREPVEAAAALWLDLLAGDWALRAVLGGLPPPDEEMRAARVARASGAVLRQAT